MADQLELEVQKRDVLGKATKRLRKAGLIPANISGHNSPSVALQIEAITFDRLRRQHGTRGVIALKSPSGSENVLVRHVQHHPISGDIIHVDFSRVSMSDRITMKVPLHYIGEAPGVKIEGGVLLHLLETLEVECRASDIIESLDVDISSLSEINSSFQAKDVKLPSGFSLITDPEELIIKVDAPRVEEETSTTTPTDADAPAPATENSES